MSSENPVIPPASPDAGKPLTEREERVLQLLCQGETQVGAARTMGLATTTVGTYIRRARIKLGARTSWQAVACFVRSART